MPLAECYACLATSAAGPSHAGLYRGQRGHCEGASGRALGAAQWTGIPLPRQPLGCNRSQRRGNALRMGYVVVRASVPAPGASHQLPLRPRARVRSLYRLQDPPAERGGRLRVRVHHLQRQLGPPMVPLHPSPQHPELGQGYRACSWPDSNELGQQSSERAGATRIRAAISIPCFEYWLLLHFRLTNKPFQGTPGGPSACEQVIREVETYLEGYRKADAGTYGRCRELLPTAIQNAKRNRRSKGSSSTNVWELVERLQELRTMRRKRLPDGTRPLVFGATLHRVRFGLGIATREVTLRRAAYPMLPLAPSPRDGQVQPRPSRGSSRRRGRVQQMMPASGSPGRLGVWPR